jgi:TQXA domain-containing protein
MKLGAALVGASVALMLSGALPAGAAGVAGKIDRSLDESGLEVYLGGNDVFATNLIGLSLPGNAKLQTYCIEIETVIPKDAPPMVEAPWDAYPHETSPFRKNNAKINWLLHNSYPFLKIEAVRKALADNGATLDHELSTKEAIAATQAATWHFSDDKNLDRKHPTPGARPSAGNVLALYDFLIGAKNVGMANQPTASLDITPKTLAGDIGKLVGPFKVATSAGKITKLTPKIPAGVKITDKDGKELAASAIKDGSEIFVSVPADATPGDGSFGLEATAPVSTGRVFVSGGVKSQSLIVAQSEAANLAVGATASWKAAATAPTSTTTPTTAAPVPQASNGALANTGVSIFVPISLGVLLLAAGAGALLFLRRRARA